MLQGAFQFLYELSPENAFKDIFIIPRKDQNEIWKKETEQGKGFQGVVDEGLHFQLQMNEKWIQNESENV